MASDPLATAASPDTAGLRFLDGGGEVGALMRAFDWASHPLGEPAQWPAALKIAVSLCLHSSFPTAIYWGPEFRLLYNDAWTVLADNHPWALGRPGAEARPDIWPVLAPQFAAMLTAGEGRSMIAQRLMMNRGGVPTETFWTYNSAPMRDEHGVAHGIVNQGLEVTAQVHAEARLRAQEERLQFALDASGNVGTWEWDVMTDRVVGDARAARLYGLDPAEAAAGASAGAFLAWLHPDDLERYVDLVQAAMAREGRISTEYRLLLPDGETRWLAVQGECRNSPDGEPDRIFGLTLDISPAKRAEIDLRRAKDEREFILTLAERQRTHNDPDDVMQLTAEALGQYLAVDRAGFFQVRGGDVIEYGACWVGGGLPPLTGAVPSALFGKDLGGTIRSGHTLAFDAPGTPGAPSDAALALTGTRAGISVPLVRGGAWQGAFYISHATPRAWTPGEVALVEEVAELSWDAVARASATARLRALNADLVADVAARTEERDRLWEVSNDLLGICDLEGRWIAVNPAWQALLGWSREEIVGRDSGWMRHPDDMVRTTAEIAHLARRGASRLFENRFRTRDGSYRTLDWKATLVGDRLYASARDVTEERRQQAALLAAEERTRMVLEAVDGVAVWTYDVAADRFHADATFAALYGFGPEDSARGVTLADVIARVHPEDLPKMEGAILRIREGGTGAANEYRLLLPDGSVRWLMARNHVVRGADGAAEQVIGVGVDVSHQRELEERLRQAQKMEAVGQLTGGLAHDFNNLLAGISGALEMMQVRLKQGRIDDLPRYIGAAQTGSGRAAALTHRLLAFSRRQPLDPRPVDVVQLVAGMEELVRGTLGPSITVQIHTDPASWTILADANQLENALLNLCINARDAMPAGGVMTIATENVWLDAAAAAERDLPEGAYLSLCVTDTGTGMSPEVIARAFDPFFTTKPMGQGTGLGLSMIYGFVRQSGGQIHIRSAPGEGTTMCLHLPRHYGTAPGDTATGGAAALPAGSGETVLVVDDEPTVRMLVSEILVDLGYKTIEAETGAEALALLEKVGRIDLLVTDVGLPGGINGRQVADAARAALPELPVLFITGFAENAVVGDGPLEPGMALIAKPFAIETLAARVRAMLGGG